MKKDIKLFFLDLDGTLIDEVKDGKRSISKRNLHALETRAAKGYDACISTGRIGKVALKYLKMSGLKYAVTGNGAQIIDNTGKIIRELNISSDEMKLIKDFVVKNDLSIKIDKTYIAYNVCSPEGHYMAKKLNYKISEEVDFNLNIKRIKLIIWGKKPEELPKIIPKFKKIIPNLSIVSAERGWTLEVTNIKATKAEGNLWAMKNLFNIDDPSICCHIGDTMNDFSVIGVLGYFVAPLDAQKDLLAKAPFHTVEHFKNCVAEVMEGNFWKSPFVTENK